MIKFPFLTLLTITPLIVAVIVACLPARTTSLARRLGLGFSLLSLMQAFILWARFNGSSGEIQFVERNEWIPSIGAEYYVGIDGLGLLMLLLSALLVPFALLASKTIQENLKA